MVSRGRQRRVEQRGNGHSNHVLISKSVVPSIDDRVVGLAGTRGHAEAD